MNLFFLNQDPKKCAQEHCDRHVVKMLLEIVQMLFTAHILLDQTKVEYRKISNHKHPMAIWIRESRENYLFAAELAIELAEEYTHRYSKIHSCDRHAKWLFQNIPVNFGITIYQETTVFGKPFDNLTNIPLCMPDDCKLDNAIDSYRKYYNIHKRRFCIWTGRNIPIWFLLINNFFTKKLG